MKLSVLYVGKSVNDALAVMQQRCKAAFYHYIKTTNNDENEQHRFCPTENDTWCFYQKKKLAPNSEGKRSIRNQLYLDPVFYDVLQPMIHRLTSKQLLKRCLRGLTQNSNESLNSVVWYNLFDNSIFNPNNTCICHCTVIFLGVFYQNPNIMVFGQSEEVLHLLQFFIIMAELH